MPDMDEMYAEGLQFQKDWHELWSSTPESEREQLLVDMDAWRAAQAAQRTAPEPPKRRGRRER